MAGVSPPPPPGAPAPVQFPELEAWAALLLAMPQYRIAYSPLSDGSVAIQTAPSSLVWRLRDKQKRSHLRSYMRLVEPRRRFRRAPQGRRADKPIHKGRQPCNVPSVQQEPFCRRSASFVPHRPKTREKLHPDWVYTLRDGGNQLNNTSYRHPAPRHLTAVSPPSELETLPQKRGQQY
jgi:hypothetical protein